MQPIRLSVEGISLYAFICFCSFMFSGNAHSGVFRASYVRCFSTSRA